MWQFFEIFWLICSLGLIWRSKNLSVSAQRHSFCLMPAVMFPWNNLNWSGWSPLWTQASLGCLPSSVAAPPASLSQMPIFKVAVNSSKEIGTPKLGQRDQSGPKFGSNCFHVFQLPWIQASKAILLALLSFSLWYKFKEILFTLAWFRLQDR